MPKKLLLEIAEKLRKLLLKLPSRRNIVEDTPPEIKNLSPNLLSPVDVNIAYSEVTPKIVKFTSTVVYLICGLFLVLLTVSYIIDLKLNNLLTTRDSAIKTIEESSDVMQQIEVTARMLSSYKEIRASNKSISNVLVAVIAAMEKDTDLYSLYFRRDSDSFIINATADSPAQFAFAISNLLKEPQVKDIVLESVELQSGKANVYGAVLEVRLQ